MKYNENKIVYEAGDYVVVVSECMKTINGKKLIGKTLQLLPCQYDGYVNVTIPDEYKDWRNEDGGYNITAISVRPATQAEVEQAMKSKKDTIQVGDYVVLLESSYGFEKNDVAIVKSIDSMSIVVFVEGRKSESGLAPNVAYMPKDVRLATLREVEEYKQKSQFKVGDWVYIKDSGFQINARMTRGDVMQIKSFEKKGYRGNKAYEGYVVFTDNSYGSFDSYNKKPDDYIRLATPEEITQAKVKASTFKVGDWVYAEQQYGAEKVDYRSKIYIPVFQIQEVQIQSGSEPGIKRTVLRPVAGQSTGIDAIHCRLATAEEIKNVSRLSLGKFPVELDSGGIAVGCKTMLFSNYSKSDLIKFIRLLQYLEFRDGRFADTTITMDELKRLKEKLM